MALRPVPKDENLDYESPYIDSEFEEMLYARHVEIESLGDLEKQRGTPIPALFNQFYKFIQNPSTVSVDTFKRMVDTDDTIGSGVDFLTTCLSARLGRYVHASKEVTDFVNKALTAVEGGFKNNYKEILSATWAGFFVGEKVYDDVKDIGFIPTKLVPLPPSTILFETERTGELTQDGILQYQRGYNPFMGRGAGFYGASFSSAIGVPLRPDPFAKLGDAPFPIRISNSYNYMSIRIPKQKCVHYAFNAQGQFRSPYGRSLLRRIYKYYVMKDAILQMMSIALDRKGTALTIVYYDPVAPIYDPSKVAGGTQSAASARGNPQAAIHPAQAAKQAFSNIHNDSVIYLPGKKDEIYGVDFMPQSPNTADFIQALDFCNKGNLRGLLIPALMFGDGAGGYALGEVHAKTFEKVLDGINEGAEEVLLKQWIKDILVLNFPRSAWEKDGLGSFSKREMTQDEVEKIMNTYEKGINSGIIDTQDLADLNKMRDAIGFEERSEPIEREDLLNGEAGSEGIDPDKEDSMDKGETEPKEEKELSAGFMARFKSWFRSEVSRSKTEEENKV